MWGAFEGSFAKGSTDMRRVAVGLVRVYQVVLSPFLKQLVGVQASCRYNPTCSEYTIMVINQYGILYGSYLAGKRLLSCQPFFHRRP